MKVLMILGHATGGLGGHVDRLVRAVLGEGNEVLVVTAADTAQQFGWDEARLLWPVHGGVRAPRGLVDWHRVMRLAGTVDVVHAHGLQAAVVAAVAVLRARPRPRLVVSLHNDVPPSSRSTRAVLPLVRWALRRADLVTGASSDLADLAGNLGGRRVEVEHVASDAVVALLERPLLDEQHRRNARAALFHEVGAATRDPALPLVLSVARLAPQKDLGTLAAAALASSTPASWVLVGGGDETVRAALANEPSGIRLQLVGPRRDVAGWLQAADVFVLTSRWEARALVVQEAMAAGLPVVVTRTGGLPELVGDAGVLVPVGDSRAVAAAVDGLLADDSERRRRSERGRAIARTWDTPDEEARRWVARYTETLGG